MQSTRVQNVERQQRMIKSTSQDRPTAAAPRRSALEMINYFRFCSSQWLQQLVQDPFLNLLRRSLILKTY